MLLATGLISTSINVQRVAKNKANQATQEFKYKIEGYGVGVQGTYQVKVWLYSKKPNVAIEQCKKSAAHGIIFKGFTGIDKFEMKTKTVK